MDPDFQTDFPDNELREDPARLLEWIRSTAGRPCAGCGKALCAHQRLLSRAVAGPAGTRCLDCLAQGLHLPAPTLSQNLAHYIAKRDCYRKAWDWIGGEEPDCPMGKLALAGTLSAPSPTGPGEAKTLAADGEWDAGDLGCGDLLLPLRGKMRQLGPGQILRLTARDPSAPEDIPAWCGVTGHRLIHAEHPTYWICRRED